MREYITVSSTITVLQSLVIFRLRYCNGITINSQNNNT